MAIFIDPPMWPAHGTLWSHLVSDADYDELHDFAKRLGLPRRGFDLDHYDVSASRHADAVELGAIAVGPQEVVHRLRASGLRVKQVDRPLVTPVRRRQFLLAHWGGLSEHALGPDHHRFAEKWASLGNSVIARWNESHRRYHDELHLEDVLLNLDHLATMGERITAETMLAAWFHDAVYDGALGDDEQASADLAVALLGSVGVDSALADRVAELIVGTTPTASHKSPALPLAHLLDADLAIFGAAEPRYARYTSAVRAEYAHVPEAEFRAARAEILAGYLDREEIFFTRASQTLWEKRARANLTQEIALLRSPAAES